MTNPTANQPSSAVDDILQRAHSRLVLTRDLTDEAQADCEVIRDVAQIITAQEQRLGELDAEVARLSHLHQLDHSLADQWQAKNAAQEQRLGEIRAARDEHMQSLLRIATATHYQSGVLVDYVCNYVKQQEQRIDELRQSLVELMLPYEALLADTESARWICDEIWQAIQVAMIKARAAALENRKPVEGTCEWKNDPDGYYATSCGEAFEMINDESLTANGFQFCYHCGKPIREVHSAHGD